MTRRSAALPLAALASLAILVAACGGDAATTGPASSGTPATQAATQAPASTDGSEPSFDLSSFHSDQKLEDLFPKEIGGETLTILSMSGDQFMGTDSSPELEAALGAVGKTPADLTVAFGGNTALAIIAFRVAGVPSSSILSALITAFQNENSSTSSDVNISGKSIKKFVPTDSTEDTLYVYTAQDVVFTVSGSGVTDALLNEVFSKLP